MSVDNNMAKSFAGSIDKAILCIKKPVNNDTKVGINVSKSKNPVDLHAKLASMEKNGAFSLLKDAEKVARDNGYHVLKVKYNPSRISFSSRAGSFIQPGPGGPSTNTLSQYIVPAETYMSVEILFDDVNAQDAFMFDKFTNISTGAIVSDVSSAVKHVKEGGYSVKEEVEAMIGMMTQSETRQVVFYWSEMVFAGEVISLDVRYTMFNVAGNPIRAVVRLTVRESTETGKSEYWTKAFDDLEREGSNFKKVGNLLGFN